MGKAQGSTEYLLVIGAAILVVAISVSTLSLTLSSNNDLDAASTLTPLEELASANVSQGFGSGIDDATLDLINAANEEYYSSYVGQYLQTMGIDENVFDVCVNYDENYFSSNEEYVKHMTNCGLINNAIGYSGEGMKTAFFVSGEGYMQAYSLFLVNSSDGNYYLSGALDLYDGFFYPLIEPREGITPEDFFVTLGDSVEQSLARAAYAKLMQGLIDSPDSNNELVLEMVRLLGEYKTQGQISGYSIVRDRDIGTTAFDYLPSGDFIYERIDPIGFAYDVKYYFDAQANPGAYATSEYDSIQSKLFDNILFVKTPSDLNEVYSLGFIPKKIVREYFTVLNQSISKEEKLQIFSALSFDENLSIEFKKEERQTKKLLFSAPAETFDSLIQGGEVIIAPSKKIGYFVGAESASDILSQKKSERDFANLLIKDILPNLVNHRYTLNSPEVAYLGFGVPNGKLQTNTIIPQNKGVDKLASILSDQDLQTVFITAHGEKLNNGDFGILAEQYYLGPVINNQLVNPADYNLRVAAVNARVASLRSVYGNSAILGFKYSPPLGNGASGKNQIKHKFFSIMVSKDFFNFFSESVKKKSAVIMTSCYGGLVAPQINSRVTLAVIPDSLGISGPIYRDLSKIFAQLYKDQTVAAGQALQGVGSLIRNYEIITKFTDKKLRAFKQNKQLVYSFGGVNYYTYADQDTALSACNSDKDNLCQMQLFGSNPKVAISPHVELADMSKVKFNVPMDTSIPASDVVTVEYDLLCDGSSHPVINWSNSSNREITLDFGDSFDSSSNYFALVTVHSDNAKSALSGIKLSGNPECGCTKTSGYIPSCTKTECISEPSKFEYNGNTPNTDFTYVVPCKVKICAPGINEENCCAASEDCYPFSETKFSSELAYKEFSMYSCGSKNRPSSYSGRIFKLNGQAIGWDSKPYISTYCEDGDVSHIIQNSTLEVSPNIIAPFVNALSPIVFKAPPFSSCYSNYAYLYYDLVPFYEPHDNIYNPPFVNLATSGGTTQIPNAGSAGLTELTTNKNHSFVVYNGMIYFDGAAQCSCGGKSFLSHDSFFCKEGSTIKKNCQIVTTSLLSSAGNHVGVHDSYSSGDLVYSDADYNVLFLCETCSTPVNLGKGKVPMIFGKNIVYDTLDGNIYYNGQIVPANRAVYPGTYEKVIYGNRLAFFSNHPTYAIRDMWSACGEGVVNSCPADCNLINVTTSVLSYPICYCQNQISVICPQECSLTTFWSGERLGYGHYCAPYEPEDKFLYLDGRYINLTRLFGEGNPRDLQLTEDHVAFAYDSYVNSSKLVYDLNVIADLPGRKNIILLRNGNYVIPQNYVYQLFGEKLAILRWSGSDWSKLYVSDGVSETAYLELDKYYPMLSQIRCDAVYLDEIKEKFKEETS